MRKLTILATILSFLATVAAAQCPKQLIRVGPFKGAGYGRYSAMDGTYLVIATPTERTSLSWGNPKTGALRIYEKLGGQWLEMARLAHSDAKGKDDLGRSVAVDGFRIVAGCPKHDAGGRGDAGAAYVFTRAGGSWIETAKIVPSDSQVDAKFGSASDVSASTIVVGAPLHDGGEKDEGAAYVYELRSGLWTEAARLASPTATTDDRFGQAVAVSGATVAVAATHDDIQGKDSGSVHLFVKQGSTWVLEATLFGPHPDSLTPQWRFGSALALQANTLVVGSSNGESGAVRGGVVHVFDRVAGSWSLTSTLAPASLAAGDSFGSTVALDGATLAVGRPGDDQVASNAGAAHLYRRDDATAVWTESGAVRDVQGGPGYAFGYVSLAGTDLHIGAPGQKWYSAGNGVSEVWSVASFCTYAKPISLSAGGACSMVLDAGPAHAGEVYVVVGSISGTSPGTAIGGVVVPLNLDGYLLYTLRNPGRAPLYGAPGMLDAAGRSSAQFDIGPGTDASLIGTTVQHAFAALDLATLVPTFVSNADSLDLVP